MYVKFVKRYFELMNGTSKGRGSLLFRGPKQYGACRFFITEDAVWVFVLWYGFRNACPVLRLGSHRQAFHVTETYEHDEGANIRHAHESGPPHYSHNGTYA